MLAAHFLQHYARRLGRPQLRLSEEAIATLSRYAWPGNIRELENTLHNAVLLSQETLIGPGHLRLGHVTEAEPVPEQDVIDQFIRQQLQHSETPLYPRIIESLVRNAYALSQGKSAPGGSAVGDQPSQPAHPSGPLRHH